MKYCNDICFTSARSDGPATDQMLFTSAPMVQGPGCASTTIDGPMLSFPCPRTRPVAVGKANIGPAPQITLCGLAGEKKNVGVMSPKPNTPAWACTSIAARYGGVFSSIPKTSRFAVPGAG